MSTISKIACPLDSERDLRRAVQENDDISLGDLFRTVWSYRSAIFLWTTAFACLTAVVLGGKYVSGSRAMSQLQFKLNFEGADKGRYANGLDFSINEIISPFVLKAVYETNRLDEWLPYDGFRDAIAVMKSDAGLESLETKYRVLLQDKGLTSEGRQRLLEEYEAQKLKFFEQADYQLSLRDDGNRIPRDLHGKLLGDVLAVWARSAQEHKGIHLYQIPVITDDIFTFDVDVEEDRVVLLDRLNRVLQRIHVYADQVAALPGALFQHGPSGASITSIQMRLRDLERFRLMPMIRYIRQSDLKNGNQRSVFYLEERIYNLSLKEQELDHTIQLLRESLVSYFGAGRDLQSVDRGEIQRNAGAIMPQIGDGFLDRLVNLANESKDAEYRQSITQEIIETGKKLLNVRREIAYYRDLLNAEGPRPGGVVDGRQQYAASFEEDFEAILADIKSQLHETTGIYHTVSQTNLRAEQALFTVLGPVQYRDVAVLPLRKAVTLGVVLILIFFLIVIIVSIVRGNMNSPSARAVG